MFKYKVLQSSNLCNEQTLDEVGKDGWRLITIIPKDGYYFYYFERYIEI